MKSSTVFTFIVLTTLFALNQNAFAATTENKPRTPQQERMAACGHKSKGMKGDERRKFMSECLKGKDMPMENKDKMMMPQERMKTCNAEADHKKLMGNERKDFVHECLNHGHK